MNDFNDLTKALEDGLKRYHQLYRSINGKTIIYDFIELEGGTDFDGGTSSGLLDTLQARRQDLDRTEAALTAFNHLRAMKVRALFPEMSLEPGGHYVAHWDAVASEEPGGSFDVHLPTSPTPGDVVMLSGWGIPDHLEACTAHVQNYNGGTVNVTLLSPRLFIYLDTTWTFISLKGDGSVVIPEGLSPTAQGFKRKTHAKGMSYESTGVVEHHLHATRGNPLSMAHMENVDLGEITSIVRSNVPRSKMVPTPYLTMSSGEIDKITEYQDHLNKMNVVEYEEVGPVIIDEGEHAIEYGSAVYRPPTGSESFSAVTLTSGWYLDISSGDSVVVVKAMDLVGGFIEEVSLTLTESVSDIELTKEKLYFVYDNGDGTAKMQVHSVDITGTPTGVSISLSHITTIDLGDVTYLNRVKRVEGPDGPQGDVVVYAFNVADTASVQYWLSAYSGSDEGIIARWEVTTDYSAVSIAPFVVDDEETGEEVVGIFVECDSSSATSDFSKDLLLTFWYKEGNETYDSGQHHFNFYEFLDESPDGPLSPVMDTSQIYMQGVVYFSGYPYLSLHAPNTYRFLPISAFDGASLGHTHTGTPSAAPYLVLSRTPWATRGRVSELSMGVEIPGMTRYRYLYTVLGKTYFIQSQEHMGVELYEFDPEAGIPLTLVGVFGITGKADGLVTPAMVVPLYDGVDTVPALLSSNYPVTYTERPGAFDRGEYTQLTRSPCIIPLKEKVSEYDMVVRVSGSRIM